jgi:tetratricopeptide (TPR) repeat protein
MNDLAGVLDLELIRLGTVDVREVPRADAQCLDCYRVRRLHINRALPQRRQHRNPRRLQPHTRHAYPLRQLRAFFARGVAQYERSQWEQATRDYSRALDLKPGWGAAYLGRGVAYAAAGQTERAIADYSQALTLTPDAAVAYCNRGLAYQRLGRRDDAVNVATVCSS